LKELVSFLGVGLIVCVFVPNYFMCVIDISRFPPAISILPKRFAASVCGRCCANIPVENHVIDLDSGDVFAVSLDFSSFAVLRSIINDTGWEVVAHVCAAARTAPHLSNMLRLTEFEPDDLRLVSCVRCLFQCLGAFRRHSPGPKGLKWPHAHHSIAPQFSTPNLEISPEAADHPLRRERQLPNVVFEYIAELDAEFPSADGRSRRVAFRTLLRAFLNGRQGKAVGAAAQRAIEELHRQNKAALVLREALDLWVHDFSPPVLRQLTYGIAFHSETVVGSFPAVPCLKEELSPMIVDFCSRPIAHSLASGIMSGTVAMSEAELDEVLWWKERVPTIERAHGAAESGSSSIQSISGSSSANFPWAIDTSLSGASLQLTDLSLGLVI
jgi:hypothetical protein